MARTKQTKRKRALALLAAEGEREGSDERGSNTLAVGGNTGKTENPLLAEQSRFMDQNILTETERHELFSPSISSDRRAELWMAQADLGEKLVNEYSWAIPSATAIRIIKEFSPLVEIGCGSNAYWCKILTEAGVDIVGYDVNTASGGLIEGKSTTNNKKLAASLPSYIKQGGPDILSSKELKESGRTLFLCYPDEHEDEDSRHVEPHNHKDGDAVEEEDGEIPSLPISMGWQSLHHYSGDYVIHVGETFLDANFCMDQAPWGRSSSPEFQQRLASEFHCLLKVELPNWLHTRDSISVWKRSTISTIVFAEDEGKGNEDGQEDDEVEYRHIPRNERLPMNIAAPCLEHLLPESQPPNKKPKKEKREKKSQTDSSHAAMPTRQKKRQKTGDAVVSAGSSRQEKTRDGKKRHEDDGKASSSTVPHNARAFTPNTKKNSATSYWRENDDANAGDNGDDNDEDETPW